MADNVTFTTPAYTAAADEIAGAQYQRVKLTLGADGENDGDVSSANPVPVKDQPVAQVEKIDQATATVTYFGWAAPGTATSAASWRIQRMSVSGTVTTMEWADGNVTSDNIWDNRASLTYL